LDISIRSGDIRAQSEKGSKIEPKLAFGGGQPPKFLDRSYKIEHASEHDAKFRGDQLRGLGDYALKKNKELL